MLGGGVTRINEGFDFDSRGIDFRESDGGVPVSPAHARDGPDQGEQEKGRRPVGTQAYDSSGDAETKTSGLPRIVRRLKGCQ